MKKNLSQTKEWNDLKSHCNAIKDQKILSFFDEDKDRFNNLSQSIDGLFFDYSKQRINNDTTNKLCALARARGLEEKRDAMFLGEKINKTENRAVLHTALRDPDAPTEVIDTLARMKTLSDKIRKHECMGSTGKPIEKIVSLGVGGSDLGPRLVCNTLKSKKDFPVYFVSNIDPYDIDAALKDCEPETTLFIVVSKSFGTHETIENFKRAKNWLETNITNTPNIMSHFIGITANKDAALTVGFDKNNILPMWEWVNGRFSVWSAVGLPIAIALGFEKFQAFLNGAHKTDTHFKTSPLEDNVPVLMALIGIWNINFLHHYLFAVLPYAQELFHLPAYLQQLDMESNGKSADMDGNLITDYKTGPVLFGEVGTNGQHSFYQNFHQGTESTPCDFIGFKNKNTNLLNNMLAQSEALMMGQDSDNMHHYFKGNNPSSTLLFDELTPETLGMLIALYEHKIFVQGVIWNINSFDQFGVELGKKLAKKLDAGDLTNADPSTKGLYSLINKT